MLAGIVELDVFLADPSISVLSESDFLVAKKLLEDFWFLEAIIRSLRTFDATRMSA